MSADHIESRRRSRPVRKPSVKQKIKRNRSAMFLAIIIVLMLVLGSSYVVVTNLTGNTSNASHGTNNNSSTSQANPIAVIDTSMGVIKVELYEDKAPITCENFIKLANDGFYNGLVFHRVIKGFMIQGGGFYPNGTAKQSPYGNIQFESSDLKHVDGAISMASTGAKVGGSSQFFICDGAQRSLDGNYAVFGKVIDGMSVVREIASVKTTTKFTYYQDWPVENIIINSIVIER